ncbi:MAG: hypothetical protein ACRD96_23435, partial [Bryobacteraceae bacterium]
MSGGPGRKRRGRGRCGSRAEAPGTRKARVTGGMAEDAEGAGQRAERCGAMGGRRSRGPPRVAATEARAPATFDL